MANDQDTSVTLLIDRIRQRSRLWDVRQQSIPGIKKAQERLWADVAKLQRSSVDDIKNKWKNLRKAFTRQLKKVPKTADNQYDPQRLRSDWPHFTDMLFLVDPSMIPAGNIKTEKTDLPPRKATKRRSNDSIDDDNSSDDQGDDDVSALITKRRRTTANTNDDAGPSNSEDVSPVPRLNEEENEDENEEEMPATPELSSNFDSDCQWLLSFHSFIRPLSVPDKLKIRSAVTNAFVDIFKDIEGRTV